MSASFPPDIRTNSRGWFRHFDVNHTGRLEKNEVISAFQTTFGAFGIDPRVLAGIVQEIWPVFDMDGSGAITEQEFLARDGLCDTLLAQFPSSQSPPAAPVISMNCWNCHNSSSVQAPPGIYA